MSETAAGTSGATPAATLGKKNLTTIHAVAQALAIGPMFSVALVLGSVSRPDIGAGWNATLAVLLAGLGVLAIAYTISLYARRFAGAGAVYEYLTHGAHPWVGVFTAGFFFVGALFLGGGGIYLGLGILGDGFWQAHISSAHHPAWWIWGMIALGIVLVLNYFGVRLAIRAMLTFAAISFVPMLILAVVIIGKGGDSGNSLSVFNPGETSLFGVSHGGVLGGILLGILLFVGFEAAASIGEESEDPHRSIPRALIGTVAVAGAFFVVMAYAFSIGFGKAGVGKGLMAAPTALDDLATRYVGSWYATILDLVVIFDALALALAICVMIGRGFFALGRDGLLPKAFAKTSRYDTPWVGNLMVGVGGIGLVILVWATNYLGRFLAPGPDGSLVPIFPNNQFAVFILTATIGSFAIELVYLALAVFGFRLVQQGGNKLWQYAVVAVAVATPLLGFFGALKPAPHDRSNYNWEAAYWTIGLIVVAVVWFAIVVTTRRSKVDNAASHAAEHHGVPPLDETIGFQPAE